MTDRIIIPIDDDLKPILDAIRGKEDWPYQYPWDYFTLSCYVVFRACHGKPGSIRDGRINPHTDPCALFDWAETAHIPFLKDQPDRTS